MQRMDIVQKYFDAWNAHDPAAILACFVPGGTYSDPVGGKGLMGKALADYSSAIFTAFPDVRFAITSVVAQGQKVVVEWLGEGTHKGPLMGAAATGKTFQWPGVDLIEVTHDRVRTVQGYFDSATLLKQLGLQ
jgi:steroid delta-isomerase-like uncharacterized protein